MAKNRAQLVVTFESDRKCSICFSTITRRCLTDWCRHHFCFKCLSRWAEEHNYCPECRQVFKAILYVNDLRYDKDFDVFVIENEETRLRRNLITRSNALKNELLKEVDKRKTKLNQLKPTITELENICDRIESNIRELDSKERKNNGDLGLTLNRVAEQLEFYKMMEELEDEIPAAQPNGNNAIAQNGQRPEDRCPCCKCWLKYALEAVLNYIVCCFRFKIKLF